MGSLWKKFGTVMWKNGVLKKRHWLATTLEVLMPTVLFIVVAILRNSIDDPQDVNPAVVYDNPYNFWQRSHRDSFTILSFCLENGEFYMIPEDNDFVKEMAKRFNQTLENVCSDMGWETRMKILTTNDINLVISRYEDYITEYGVQGDDDDDDGEIDSGGDNSNNNGDDVVTSLPRVYGAAIFSSDQSFADQDLSYTLRFCYDSDNYYEADTEHLFNPWGPYTEDPEDPEVEETKYYVNTETAIQAILDLLFIQDKMEGDTEDFLPVTKPLTQSDIKYTLADYGLAVPAHADNEVAVILEDIMPMYAAISFIFIVPPLIKRIVHEKETGVKEFMRMMGLPGYINWLAWFLSALFTVLLINIIITLALVINFKVAPVIGYSDAGLLYVYFTLYGVALIFMMFAVSTFIDNANLALAAGIVVHFLTFFWPYGVLASSPETYDEMSLGIKLLLQIFPNVGLYLGIKGMLRQEESTFGIHWDTLGDPLMPGDDLTMGMILGMFIADAFIYGLLTWYVDQVKPGPFGQAKKLYFPFQKSYWCGSQDDAKYDVKDFVSDQDSEEERVWEAEPEGTPGVQVQDLHKIFSSKIGKMCRKSSKAVHAVNGVRFSAFPGQIMALLGHNGAGKTTTMSILTGLYSATSGTAVINGYDINTNIERIRGSLGLCPQHNMLFPSLTVSEHLRFFGMLKGLGWKEAKREASEVAEKVILGKKKGKKSTTLSGGMKRKLHLGISIIGDSTILLLDEPTSGMDPEARREIWDLLQDFKENRTIILTTHFMEEADALGDRIAIMAAGQVKCYGTSMFLKKKYGKGYRLTMTKDPSCHTRVIKDLVREHIPGAETISNVSGELAMSLPTEDESQLPGLLKALSSRKAEIGVDNFGLSITTLEDVFLKVGRAEQDEDMEFEEEAMNNNNNVDGLDKAIDDNYKRDLMRAASVDSNCYAEGGIRADNFRAGYAKGAKLFMVQMKGLMTKRALQTMRNWIMYTIMAIIPIVLAIMSDLIINVFDFTDDTVTMPALKMTLADYEDSIAFVDISPTDDIVWDELAQRFNGHMVDVINAEGSAMEVVDSNLYMTTQVEFQGMEAYGRKYLLSSEINGTQVYVPDCDDCNGNGHVINDAVEFRTRFNTVPYHMRPMARNLIDNGIYRTFVPSAGQITATFEPIIIEEDWILQWEYESFVYPSTLVYGVLLAIGWMLLLATFLIFPIRERMTNAKQVQIMAGVHPITYWSSHLLWDFSIFIVVSAIVTIIVVFVDERGLFSTPEAGGTFFLLMIMYGLSGIMMSYTFSFMTNSTPSAFALYIVAVLIAGVVMAFVVWFLRLVALDVMYDEDPRTGEQVERDDYGGPDLELISDVLRYMFNFFPCLPHTRATMAVIQVREENLKCENQIERSDLITLCTEMAQNPSIFETDIDGTMRRIGGCCATEYVDESIAVCGTVTSYENSETERTEYVQIYDCPANASFYTWDALLGINIDLLFLAFDTVLFMAILVGMDSGWIQRQIAEGKYKFRNFIKRRQTPADAPVTLDEDVVAEQLSASRAMESADLDKEGTAMVVMDMSKRFGDFKAVRGLSFTVKQGECFGFLGVNGAGKTTSFRMLTGDEYMTTGQATLYGYDRHKDKRRFMRVIGYCPQFDSIIEVLTGREMLNLFAHIRGVPTAQRHEEIEKWIDFVGLQKYADRRCGTYSGGNKRKLNVAQALVGDPPIIFLDEPSTGVDPAARRRLWDAITSIKKRGQSVVITSHSMEECEALCDRLAIMVNGQFRCFGGPQHLKNKFGQGYSVIVKLDRESEEGKVHGDGIQQVTAFMMDKFKGHCEVKDQHSGYVHYHVSDPSVPWFSLFETMQQAKSQIGFIQDYSLGETTLEEVFLFFAQKQKTEDNKLEEESLDQEVA